MRVIRISDLNLKSGSERAAKNHLWLVNKYGELMSVKAPFILRVNEKERYYVGTEDAEGETWFIQATRNSESKESLSLISELLKLPIKLTLEVSIG